MATPHPFPPLTYADVFALAVQASAPVLGVVALVYAYDLAPPDALAILAVSVLAAVLIRPFTARRLIAAGRLVRMGPEYDEAAALAPAERGAAFARLNSERGRCLQALAWATAVRFAGLAAVALVVLFLRIEPLETGLTHQRTWFLAFLWALTARAWHQIVRNFPPGWLRFFGAMALGVFLPAPAVLYLVTTGAAATAEVMFLPGRQ
ncbi:hypothetical protein [Micromonospora sp. CPCC 206061]|uniref:hypothetical protein n=1 Tax=Micromonospora sp. CPCC 206061 TaxID=3122410 RepID=UPI002FF2697B